MTQLERDGRLGAGSDVIKHAALDICDVDVVVPACLAADLPDAIDALRLLGSAGTGWESVRG
jgi:hypothetical protein